MKLLKETGRIALVTKLQALSTILALSVLPLSAGTIPILNYSMQNGTAGGADYLDSSTTDLAVQAAPPRHLQAGMEN